MITMNRSESAGYVYGILYGNLDKCSCMTKTPNVKYHNPVCAYRKSVEEFNAKAEEPSSTTP